MKNRMIVGSLLVSLIVSVLFIRPVEPVSYKARVGIYDNRAIAIAYAASKYNPVSEKMEEYKKAKDAGDEQTVKQIEAWGEQHQRQLHRQGFCRVPVSDLLEHVKEQFPELAKQLNVDVIAMQCDYSVQSVEVVDITNELAALFDLSEKALKNIANIKNQAPIDLDELDNHKD
ncbi:MAG: hypothetical protein P9L94_05295 [Candidatus Hinthialibacter antarcticus]|nr:hypothetical protein [Candidatus Hinthialibacter antarcticus]